MIVSLLFVLRVKKNFFFKKQDKTKHNLNNTATNGTGGNSASVFLQIKLFGSEFCHFDRNLLQGSIVPSNDQVKTLYKSTVIKFNKNKQKDSKCQKYIGFA